MLFGALEAGGTKQVCAIGKEDGTILERVEYPTLTPDECMPGIIEYFSGKGISALGVASFGPVDLNKGSASYGRILNTPKPGWSGYDILGDLVRALNVPAGLETDVAGALIGEVTYGSSKGLTDVIYITVGTGIGGGIMSGGRIIHGTLHPELGHMPVKPFPGDDYKGFCVFHGPCLEGMASGKAIEDRWGRPAKELANDPAVWETESHYLAEAITTLIMTLSPQRVILGGGVMHQRSLFPLIRDKVNTALGGYLVHPTREELDSVIIPASLGDDSAVKGCIKLAMEAYRSQN